MSTPFSFGTAGSSGASTTFGSASIGGQNSSTNLFGSTTTPTTSSGIFGQSSTATTKPSSTGLFGTSNTAGASSFGTPTADAGSSQTPSVFGGNIGSNTTSGASAPSLFGTASTGNTSGGGSIFGKPTTTSSGSVFSLTPTATGGSAPMSFNFGQKKDEAQASTPVSTSFSSENQTAAPTQSGGAFGTLGKPSGAGIFGASITNNAPTSTPPGSTTPAANKTPFNFANSTTPAGPPPTDSNQAPKAPTTNLFGSTGQQPGIFSSLKAKEPSQTTPTTGGMFGGTSTTSSSPFTVAKPPAPSNTNLFGGFNASNTTSSSTQATSTPTSTAAAVPTFSFPSSNSASNAQGTQASSTPISAPSSISGLFGGANKTTPASSAPSQTPGLFGGTSSGNVNTASTAPAAAPSLFRGLGQQSSATSSATSAPSTTAPAPAATSGVFSASVAASSASQPSSTPATAAPAASSSGTTNDKPATAAALGASTAGPAPQLSRLKNKTMDEIITRWASDLSKYQKEFQDQAAKVASWDRLLVENGEKIQKLYLSTFEAERASTEVERQLASVESQQDELAAWLDRYEADVDEMFARQIGQGETLQGPDQERERTYKLAEKLTDKLDDMGKNLTSMIEAINEASSNLGKNSKSDDPLSHIVRVLNSHLQQLQWIDSNAAILQAKVAASQKLGQSISSNGYGGQENDAADDFYRSYMGRR